MIWFKIWSPWPVGFWTGADKTFWDSVWQRYKYHPFQFCNLVKLHVRYINHWNSTLPIFGCSNGMCATGRGSIFFIVGSLHRHSLDVEDMSCTVLLLLDSSNLNNRAAMWLHRLPSLYIQSHHIIWLPYSLVVINKNDFLNTRIRNEGDQLKVWNCNIPYRTLTRPCRNCPIFIEHHCNLVDPVSLRCSTYCSDIRVVVYLLYRRKYLNVIAY